MGDGPPITHNFHFHNFFNNQKVSQINENLRYILYVFLYNQDAEHILFVMDLNVVHKLSGYLIALYFTCISI